MSIPKKIFRFVNSFLSKKHVYITKSLSFRNREQSLETNFDYIRYSTLGLCHEEIADRKVKGNVAEVGVYKGEFAWRLNLLFPDRKLYLFDTFEGFAHRDVRVELEQGFSEGSQNFSDTSMDLVLSKMPHPDNCIFKKGLFPETAKDVQDTFCFVSLDADLYEPIYQGLLFFYPRLEKGGYIFIHDFNNSGYKGARQAVVKFCTENNIAYVPIPDNCGTAIISK